MSHHELLVVMCEEVSEDCHCAVLRKYSTSAIFEGRFSLITRKLFNDHTCAV